MQVYNWDDVGSETERVVYTAGTGTRSAAEFVDLLSGKGVELVVDVRRYPSSRFEHFCRENLAGLLGENGIGYLYMGEELGGYRRGGYRRFVETPEFRAGLQRLEEIAGGQRTAFVCAERLPYRCHRRFIALELEKHGWQVVHLIDKDRVWSPGDSP